MIERCGYCGGERVGIGETTKGVKLLGCRRCLRVAVAEGQLEKKKSGKGG